MKHVLHFQTSFSANLTILETSKQDTLQMLLLRYLRFVTRYTFITSLFRRNSVRCLPVSDVVTPANSKLLEMPLQFFSSTDWKFYYCIIIIIIIINGC